MQITEKVIDRVSNMLCLQVELEEIRNRLLFDGYSEYDIFLIVKAAELLNKEK